MEEKLISQLGLALRIARGEEGPQLSGDYAEDGRYAYPERIELIVRAIERYLSHIVGDSPRED